MATTFQQPPCSPAEPVVDVIHGIEISDPYRWLEDQNSPRTRQWLEEQSQYKCSYFERISCRDRIRERVAELLAADTVTEPWNIGDRYFFLKRNRAADQAAIVMRKGLFGEDTVLVDPASRSTGPSTCISIAAISGDGRFLAYSVRQGGTEHSALEILDLKTNTVLPDRLPEGFCYGIAFAPDASGFYYSHTELNDPRPHYRAGFWHKFGTNSKNDKEIFFAGEGPNIYLGLLHSWEAGALAFVLSSTGHPPRTSLYLKSLRNDVPTLPLLIDVEGVLIPFFAQDQLFACTDIAAPNRRIVCINLSNPSPDNWVDIVPESKERIHQFAIAGNQIFVTRVHRFSMTIETFGVDGNSRRKISLPQHGTLTIQHRTTRSKSLFCTYTSIGKPSTVYRYDCDRDKMAVWQDAKLTIDCPQIFIEELCYPSKDGTLIPLLLAGRKDLQNSGPLPTFLTGYGGFGTCVTPRFSAFSTFLIEQGFLFAVPALRGGSELGQQWHSAGKREKRQNAFNDFIAAAEWLIAQQRSAVDRIAIGGGSNAGLLVGAAITQRPDLFRAAICLGPLLDMTRYHLFDFAASWCGEFGSPDNEEDFKFLLTYSPYQRVQDHIPYPAVMFISGDADSRCNPMHARKMTARLQAATTSEHPILLQYTREWGHTPVQPLHRRIAALTDRLAFVCRELSIDVSRGGIA